ncbi:MAG TPA: DNA polymerase IV [Agriterribacter sp.]|nr:DNA polymerase IV [Agriterribacter sp.]
MSVTHRTIAHFDLDAFFVSVECINNPSLKGIPLIVGGSKERGVVAACSYEARKFGIQSAMPMATAMRLCPQATVVNGTRSEYTRYSRWVTEIISAKAPLFEKASIDEFYLDLSGMERFFDTWCWTIDLRNEITNQTGLPISFGLASNKMMAKIATNEAKPNGYVQVKPGMEAAFLSPLPVNAIPGIGKQTHQHLLSLGIQTIGDLSARTPADLEFLLGAAGPELWNKSQGIHNSAVVPYQEAKSISKENTFDTNTSDLDFITRELVRMTESVAYELRRDDKIAGCIAVKLRYPDFETTTHQMAIDYTCFDDELLPAARMLFQKFYRKGQAIRLLGVRLSELTNGATQTNLFEDNEKKAELYAAIDAVKERFGKGAIARGRAI